MASEPQLHLSFRHPTLADLPALAALEAASYPADEAASETQLKYRIEHANDLFLLAEDAEGLAGFVCATASWDTSLTHHSMRHHDADGESVNIHSVVTRHALRRRGVALRMLREYEAWMRAGGARRRLLLITKADVQPLYEKAGFTFRGVSPVVHGETPWNEMHLELA
eukprot:tig00001065_g6706.t1